MNGARRIGRRGAFLIILGLLQIIAGLSTTYDPPNAVQHLYFTGLIGVQQAGLAQIAIGAVIAVFALYPPGRDRWGFFIAYAAPLFWASDYAVSTITGYLAGPNLSAGSGIRGCAIWLVYAALVLTVSGMDGAPQPERPSGDDN
ncbi:hypothetical protein [Streptomyces sp. NPDC055085]